jgi:hypothetical protein
MSHNNKKKWIDLLLFLSILTVFYLSYHYGLFIVYSRFMSPNEAAQFAGYTRYMNTWIAFLILIVMQIPLIYKEKESAVIWKKGVFIFGIICLLMTSTHLARFAFDKVDTSQRQDMKERMAAFDTSTHMQKKIIYYDTTIKPDPSGYTSYQLSYELLAKQVLIWSKINPKAKKDLQILGKDAETIYIYTWDDIIKEVLTKELNHKEIDKSKDWEQLQRGSILDWN